MLKLKPYKPKKGYALATILVLLGVVLAAAASTITVSTLESKISRSEQEGTRAYYVAEAGAEDALWRLNHLPGYSSDLQADTLNISYSSPPNTPNTGQNFSVTLKNTAAGAGYGIIDVYGYSANNTFTAQRHITVNVYQGAPTNTVGSNAVMVGQSLDFNNGSASTTISSGNIYAGSITVRNGSVNAGSGNILSPGNLSGTVTTTGTVNTANYPPAAPTSQVPGFNFSSYTATSGCTSYYASETDFENYAADHVVNETVNFAGPVTCVNGGLTFSSWLRNDNIDTINITGMLVILNGSLNTLGNTRDFTLNVNDPGNGQSGIFVEGSIHNIKGTWNVNGVLYSSADIQLSNSPALTINGALIAATTATINTGSPINISYVASRVNAVFTGSSQPSVVNVQHWEDQY